jgi:hypothetical protein
LHGVEEVKTADGNDADETFHGTSSEGEKGLESKDQDNRRRKKGQRQKTNSPYRAQGAGPRRLREARTGGPESIYGTPGAGYNA